MEKLETNPAGFGWEAGLHPDRLPNLYSQTKPKIQFSSDLFDLYSTYNTDHCHKPVKYILTVYSIISMYMLFWDLWIVLHLLADNLLNLSIWHLNKNKYFKSIDS